MRLSSRKFLLAILGILAGAVLAYLGKLDGTTAGLLGSIVGAYLASNVTQKAVV